MTGANGGLRLEVARAGPQGGHVVMAARDQAKAKAARASVRGELPDASLELQPLDLASLASVRQAAASILADHPRINILINPADRRRGAQHQLNLPLEHRPVFR